MPDFRLQPSFPIASVVDAAQRNNQIQQQAKEAGNQSLLAGLQSIGQVGESLFNTRQRVAQSLAIGRHLGVDDNLARTMEPAQVLEAAKIKQHMTDTGFAVNAWRAQLGLPPLPGATTQAPADVTPASQNTPAPAGGAMLTSDTKTTPLPESNGSAPSAPAAGGSMPVPMQAPPIAPGMPKQLNPMEMKLMQHMVDANRPTQVISQADALAHGSVPHGTRIISPSSGTDQLSWETATPQQQNLAKAVYEGRVRPGDIGFKDRSRVTLLANEYATQRGLPPFKSYNADVNATMAKYATSGKLGQNALSLNTALGHAASAYDTYQALGNTDQKWLNVPINKLKTQTNDPNVVALGINLNALQGELANVFKNTGATDQEIGHWKEYLNENLTPNQYVGALSKIDELLKSRLDAMDYQRSQAGGGTGSPLISPHAKQVSDRLSGQNTPTQPGWDASKEQRYQELLDKRAGKKPVSL